MIRNFIIGLSILFFVLSGIIAFKAPGIPLRNAYGEKSPDELNAKKKMAEPENIIKQIAKEQEAHQAVVDKLRTTIARLEKQLSGQRREVHANIIEKSDSDDMNIQTARSQPEGLFLYSRPDDKNRLNEKVNVNVPKATRTIYTIQTGSYAKITDARKQYESVKERLNGEDLAYLRIEKIGRYYAVRLGRFNDYSKSEKFLKAVKSQLFAAVILKAYIKEDRIVRLYK